MGALLDNGSPSEPSKFAFLAAGEFGATGNEGEPNPGVGKSKNPTSSTVFLIFVDLVAVNSLRSESASPTMA